MTSCSLSRSLPVLLLVLLAVGCTTLPAPSPEGPAVVSVAGFSHDAFDAFLRRHVDGAGRIDYAAAAEDRADLDRYLAALAEVSPDSHAGRFPRRDDQLAYWINAYNASVIHLVLAHHPISSVMDVEGPPILDWLFPNGAGFFFFARQVLGGEAISLYALENQVIRGRFAEPRIHFALNCASASCPRLPARAFTADDLDAELERETRRFFAEARNARVDAEARTVRLSAILDWYEDDYTDWLAAERPEEPATLAAYAGRYLPPEQARALAACRDCETVFFPYDWSLNDRKGPRGAARR